PGDQAHHRHDDQSRQHAEGAGVDGGLKDGREVGAEEDVGQHDHGGEEEAGPAGGGGGPLPVQAEEEGGQEGAGQGAPAYAHELGDEGDVGAVLDDGQNHGDGDEDHHQAPHPTDLPLLVHAGEHQLLEEI